MNILTYSYSYSYSSIIILTRDVMPGSAVDKHAL